MFRPHLLFPLGLSLAALLAIAHLAHQRARTLRAEVPEIDRHVTIPAPEAARVMSLGYNEMAADLTWIRMLIYYGDNILHDTGAPDTEALIRLVNALDPQFRKAYIWGAYATTMRNGFMTQEEIQSSIQVVRRALQEFPNDWEFNWILGIRLFTEMKGGTDEEEVRRKEEGAMYIERAMHAPNAPTDLPILAASLRTKLGQKEQALRDLREMIFNTEDEKARAVLVSRYTMLVSETASHELAAAAAEFNQEWKAQFPYVSPSFYVLIGPRVSPRLDLDAMTRSALFDTGAVLASQSAE